MKLNARNMERLALVLPKTREFVSWGTHEHPRTRGANYYDVVDAVTGRSLRGQDIVWADAALGLYYRLVKTASGDYLLTDDGTAILGERVRATIAIRLREPVEASPR